MFQVVCVENCAVCHFLFCPDTGVCDRRVLPPITEKYGKNKCTVVSQTVSYCVKPAALKQFQCVGGGATRVPPVLKCKEVYCTYSD